ncbi:phosphoribosylamine--glycine ligase [Sporocytophaga myxococcoides]|uniref:Phosphoribosylamine--glycine ligase n=1 Tax=Sporocytophaga myxococcoides TaxID=153721 RepID=A0A098LLV9_9BACT|nr:phosphoribosylamine--glycine ligase [Sporocytophaga myxococcoides]GAL87307.1 phosphoribosylamine--glycine ligase [Sporocytophaga myxococcoides]
MNILIVGSGGREHTFAWKIKQSPLCKKLFVAPGNGGTEEIATNVPIQVTEFEKLGKFCLDNQVGLVLVGPEVPLVEGIVDYFRSTDSLKQIPVIGPSKEGAQLEGSKDFSKSFMVKYGIPTAASKTFTANELNRGLEYIETQSLPIVLKADGLAAGKGVIIAQSQDEAKTALREMLEDKKFGEASAKVVIEQYLDGVELSVFTISDGSTYKILPEAKDYKRIGEKDTGLNTGGMGAVSPVPFADKAFMEKVEKKVIIPTINGLKAEGIDYVGFIFFGLMNVNGEPFVIEYNARMGDPETEVVIPRIKNDFLEVLAKVAEKKLHQVNLEVSDQTATTVMLVAGGYPEDYEKGKVISGLDKVEEVLAFHAGTALKDNKMVTNGGRVIALTGLGSDIQEALAKSNKAAENIIWEKRYYRRDIGLDLLALIEK